MTEAEKETDNKKKQYTEEELEKEVEKFGGVRRYLFPVTIHEFVYVINTFMLLIIIIFVYSAFKAMKNASVSSEADPSVIPHIKLWIVTPMNMLCVASVQKLVYKAGLSRTFTYVLSTFGILLFIYAIVFVKLKFNLGINPFSIRDMFADGKMAHKGLGILYPFFGIFISFKAAIYYVMSELFGSLVASYLFWAFTNTYISRSQSERINRLLTFGAQLGLIGSTFFVNAMEEKIAGIKDYDYMEWFSMAFPCVLAIILFSAVTYKIIFERMVLSHKLIKVDDSKRRKPRAKKAKLTLSQAFNIAFSSKIVIALSLAVLAFNCNLNIVENFNLQIIKYYYNECLKIEPNAPTEKARGTFVETRAQLITGCIVMCITLCDFGKFLASPPGFAMFGFAPVLLSTISMFLVPFFSFFNSKKVGKLNSAGAILNASEIKSALRLEEIFARGSVIAFRIGKYGSFDPNKEMFSMRINESYRALFKGVYDGQFGKIGKSLGSFFAISCSAIFGDTDIRSVPIPSFLFMSLLNIVWGFSVFFMYQEYKKSVEKNADLDYGWIGKQPAY